MGVTTILRWRAGSDGHWRLRGGALTLPMIWQQFGYLVTAQEHKNKHNRNTIKETGTTTSESSEATIRLLGMLHNLVGR